jgi:hypothetical protein
VRKFDGQGLQLLVREGTAPETAVFDQRDVFTVAGTDMTIHQQVDTARGLVNVRSHHRFTLFEMEDPACATQLNAGSSALFLMAGLVAKARQFWRKLAKSFFMVERGSGR